MRSEGRLRARRAGIDYIGVGVAAIVFNSRCEMALLQRKRRAGKGLWGLPGGRAQVGESLDKAILREVEEEIGVRGAIVGTLGWLDDCNPGGHWLSAIYIVHILNGIPYNREADFHSELRWCVPENAPRGLMLVAKIAIQRLQGTRVA